MLHPWSNRFHFPWNRFPNLHHGPNHGFSSNSYPTTVLPPVCAEGMLLPQALGHSASLIQNTIPPDITPGVSLLHSVGSLLKGHFFEKKSLTIIQLNSSRRLSSTSPRPFSHNPLLFKTFVCFCVCLFPLEPELPAVSQTYTNTWDVFCTCSKSTD